MFRFPIQLLDYYFSCMCHIMGLQTFYGAGPHLLLLAGLWATREKITVNGIPNHLNYCVIFMVYSQYKMTVGYIIQPGGPQVGDPYVSHLLDCHPWLHKVKPSHCIMFSIILFLPQSGPDILTDFCYYHSCIHCSSDLLQHHTLVAVNSKPKDT
jgi:hypothetical protein